MQISKMVPVTIEVQDDNPKGCSSACWFNYDDDLCEKYNEPIQSCRNARCLAEFGTGEKPAIVPWEESKVGDVVRIGNRFYRLHEDADTEEGPCCKCAFQSPCGSSCPYAEADRSQLLCYAHPSSCDVYFTEVENSPK